MENTPMQLVWGNEVLDAGFTSKPRIITKYAMQFINYGEFAFIDVLCSYKHTSDNPFPKQETIAKDMSCSDRQIRKWISSLEEKGFLEVEYIYKDDKRVTSSYNFAGLLNACLGAYRKENMQNDIENKVKKVKKVVKKPIKSTTGTKSPVGTGQKDPVATGTKSPVSTGQNVPLIIDKSLINKSLINKLNKQSIYDQELHYVIDKVFSDKSLKNDWIESIFKLYDLFKSEITIHKFRIILFDISKATIKTNFENYLKVAITNSLVPSKAQKQIVEPVRKEMIPNFMNEEQKEEKQDQEKINLNELEELRQRIKNSRGGK
jgi:hypothetical protein